MVVLSSIVVKAALIAAGGIILTMLSVATIVLLYLCTCHSKPRGKASKTQRRADLQKQSLSSVKSSNSLVQSSSDIDYSSAEAGTAVASQDRDRAAWNRDRTAWDRDRGRAMHEDLEISQKTWSTYKTLTRDVTQRDHKTEHTEMDRRDNNAGTPPSDVDIDTKDNDAYSTAAEVAQLSKLGKNSVGHENRFCLLPPPGATQRISTVSTCSSGSGYVINSLHSPNRDRVSCYSSSSSEGYVINHLDWPKPPLPSKSTLPCIAEDSSALSVEYLQIVHR